MFALAKDARPYDEEFLQAALLHDIGKGLDPSDHVGAAVEALDGLITDRTRFLIENHMLAQEYKAGTLGHRQRARLEASEDFDDLMLLRELDDAGRVPGAVVGTVDEAIDHDVPAPIITLALLQRFRSRRPDSFTDRVLAALRNEFGGHAVKDAAPADGAKDGAG